MSQAEHVREFRFLAPENFPTGGHGVRLYQLELDLEDITAQPRRARITSRTRSPQSGLHLRKRPRSCVDGRVALINGTQPTTGMN